ncbi:MAG TPA: hypothetical protein VFD59_07295 [Nocardioidaceae bacterium]|nr:hypothetical protein [Nocardioidaceae bacterium]
MLTEVIAVSALADDWAGSSGPKRAQAAAAGIAIFQMSWTLSAPAALVLFGEPRGAPSSQGLDEQHTS